MLKEFKTKYQTLIQAYKSESARLAEYNKIFDTQEIDDKEVVSDVQAAIDYVRREKWDSFFSWISWEPPHPYLGWIEVEIKRFGAYGSIKDYSTQATISGVIKYYNGVADGMAAVLPQVTAENIEQILSEVRQAAAEEAGVSAEFAENTYHGGDALERFFKAVSIAKKMRLKHALYVRAVLKQCKALDKKSADVESLNRGSDPVENIKQLQQLIELHNVIVDAVSVFSDYDDEIKELEAYLNKALRDEAAKSAKKEYDSYKSEIIKRIRDEVVAEPISAATIKKLKKSYAKAVKLNGKRKLTADKRAKIVPFSVGSGEFDISESALTSALRSKYEDYVNLYYDSLVFGRVLNGKEREMLSAKKKETENEAKLQIEKGCGSYVVKTQPKLDFIKKNFTEFYAFVSVALLDCLIEIAYSGTFEEFSELPEELQTTFAVKTVLDYFKSKRVDSGKEAINLFYKEHKDEVYVKTDEDVAAEKERRAGLEALRDELKSQQSYLESYKRTINPN